MLLGVSDGAGNPNELSCIDANWSCARPGDPEVSAALQKLGVEQAMD